MPAIGPPSHPEEPMTTRNDHPKSASSQASTSPASYAVGYGKPPAHTRFQKGQSGNPGGRPRRGVAEQAKALALKEAYRKVTVQEGEDTQRMPVIQAILRNQLALAAKGNGPAQRTIFEIVQAIERELAAQEHSGKDGKPIQQEGRLVGNELARRIAFLLRTAGNTEP